MRTLERGCFDGIFFADVLGTYDVYGASREAGLRGAVQIPGIDPTLLIPALAACTEHLGFAVTMSTSHHAPYHTARLFSTSRPAHRRPCRLEHRDLVPVRCRASRTRRDPAPRRRYDRADEYVDVCLKLWEQSWEDGAVVLDAEADTFTDPANASRSTTPANGSRSKAPRMDETSPQRTRTLRCMAGTSCAPGVEFVAEHGRCGSSSPTCWAPTTSTGRAAVAWPARTRLQHSRHRSHVADPRAGGVYGASQFRRDRCRPATGRSVPRVVSAVLDPRRLPHSVRPCRLEHRDLVTCQMPSVKGSARSCPTTLATTGPTSTSMSA